MANDESNITPIDAKAKRKKPTGRPPKHGGESALAAIQTGDKFKGLASKTLHDVRRDYRTYGRARLVETAALRLETCSRLFWTAVLKAADEGNLAALDRYTARFGWIQSVALRAMAQVREEEKTAMAGGDMLADAIESAREVNRA